MSDQPIESRRTVCDHCRRRRIRCDGLFPCKQCTSAALACKRDHVPKRRGPKRGTGRVINELRAQEGGDTKVTEAQERPGSSQSTGARSIDQWVTDSAEASGSSTPLYPSQWVSFPSDGPHSAGPYPPTSNYVTLIPSLLELFIEHLYPIMPIIHVPTLQTTIMHPLQNYEKNLVYALCAVTSTHMSGKSIPTPSLSPLSPTASWELIGQFFLSECILVRQTYDFVEDLTLWAVISSYFVSTAYFELNMSRKSWYYLREALTLAQDLGLHNEITYQGLVVAESICRRRTFWILYVTER